VVARAEPLTREVIVDRALARAVADGLESLSTRGLAAELGVTAMALYRHVRNKDEILDAVVDALLEDVLPPAAPRDEWRRWREDQARSLRGLFLRHPIAVAVFARQPVTTPAARARLTAALDVLDAAGFGHDDALRAFAAVHTYTVGFCALEAARSSTSFGPTLDEGTPKVGPDAAAIRQFVSEDQFGYGLRAVIAGLSPSGGSAPR
jgi:TetR/AcrR family tetracycline transcriptional repressor